MRIQIDTREKPRAIEKILSDFDRQHIDYFKQKLSVGDYMDVENPKYVIDRKQNLLELAQNVCQDRERFIRELKRAKAEGIQLDFLVEHGYGIFDIEDVKKWTNPRLKVSPLAVSGERLYKILKSLEASYGVHFYFCSKEWTALVLLKLLRNGKERIQRQNV